mmetsp:Transcript_6897/g.19443  ORF Transcript_6897/g.19443 Transcript_6897/m.19443 type:complete len:202 (-) Transcript_6897:636-1241(-)
MHSLAPVVRLLVPWSWAHGNDGVGVEGGVRTKVVLLDVLHVDGLLDLRHLIDLFHVLANVVVLVEEFFVRFEIDDIHIIKADEGHEQADVGLCQDVAGHILLLAENLLNPVKGGEQFVESCFIGTLALCKAAAIHAIVDGGVYPLIDRLDAVPELSGVQVQVGVLGNAVESRVEHADDLGALVVHNGASLLVPKDGHRVNT